MVLILCSIFFVIIIVFLNLEIRKQSKLISIQNDLILKLQTSLFEKDLKLKNSISLDQPKQHIISYAEWYLKKCDEKLTNVRLFNEYWDEVCKDEYFAWYIRKISKYPTFLVNLINEIQKFDFEKVSEFMKSRNWTWNDRKESPTTAQMIDCIFSLADDLDTQNDDSGCSTGGFTVKRMTDDKADISFSFSYYE